MKEQTARGHLTSLGACREAMNWINDRTSAQIWDECERADWMIWWAARTKSNTRMQIVRSASACARTALMFVPFGENRPRLAIEAAERWAECPTLDNAADAVYAAANAVYAANAADAVYAAYAADAYADAANAAVYAAYADAANAAVYAAYAADAVYAAYAAAAYADAAYADAADAADVYAANAAVYSAYAADYSAYAADADARNKAHIEMCAIVRAILAQPWSENE